MENIYIFRQGEDANRPTIVFLHDSLGCAELWRDFPQALGERAQCNVLVYDRQGYGRSAPFLTAQRDNNYLEAEADILAEILTACGLNKAILFGHSDGGSIALIAAAKYPSLVTAVITEGAHIFVEDITLNGIRDAVMTYHNTNLKERLQKYHGNKTAAVFHMWVDTWLTQTFRSWNIEHFLPQIQCPVLAIQGERDEFGTIAQVNGIMRQTAGKAQSLIIPGIGHTPHKDAKETVLAQTAAFISCAAK
ncbi:alpha/beta fold hydrolase [Chitinophaga vietnamensis]|uniref:alpha/beta fold hydrolase n=1 Tax=Chitinophaga vietnamensis TaxID=2593957 RepID=UPI00117829C9|nr:alpha/beta hydrolase [Chitinophaga vietnamensis]